MKAIFKCEGKELVNEKIEDVSLAIEFFDEELDDIFEKYDSMEDYVSDLLERKTNIYNMFRIGLEAPIDGIVYFHFDYFTGEGEEGCYPKTKEELQILIKMYNEVLKAFNKDQVKIEVTSNTLWDNRNQEGFSLDEFLKMFELVEKNNEKVQLINKENNKVILESQPLDGKMCGEYLKNIIIRTKDSNTLGNLVNLKNNKGNFRNMSEILNDIKRIWITTKEEDKDKILGQMVGKENINKFKSILKW